MWDVMCEDMGIRKRSEERMSDDQGTLIGIERAYLVGDAAGRKSDHSDSDIHFCENLGIKHFTPEEFFLGKGNTEEVGHKFDPRWYLPPSLGGGVLKPSMGKIL